MARHITEVARKVSHCSKNDAGAEAHGVHSTVYQTENRARQHSKAKGSILGWLARLFKPRANNARQSEDRQVATGPPTSSFVPKTT